MWVVRRTLSTTEPPRAAVGPQSTRPVVGSSVDHWIWTLSSVTFTTRIVGASGSAQSAVAVALMGAINAVATAAACLVAGLWWLAHRPGRAWWHFTIRWIPCCILAVLWWMVPLLLLGRVSPPFLDYIESSGVTTEWASLAEILPLTSDWTALEERIDDMTPVGNTNVTIGAVWGWATLSPGAPFTEAKPATEPRLKKYMILLTDGDNTENRFTTSGNEIDDRTKLACANVKAAGINLYTIRVINGDAALLKGCASDASMYYDVQDASQLDLPGFTQ